MHACATDETSMYRVQIPSVASYGARLRTVSDDGKWRFSSCSCGEVASPSLFHKKTARSEEGSYLLTRNGVQLVNRANEMQYPTATVAVDCETQALLHNEPDADAEGAVSEHIVFSGDRCVEMSLNARTGWGDPVLTIAAAFFPSTATCCRICWRLSSRCTRSSRASLSASTV